MTGNLDSFVHAIIASVVFSIIGMVFFGIAFFIINKVR